MCRDVIKMDLMPLLCYDDLWPQKHNVAKMVNSTNL